MSARTTFTAASTPEFAAFAAAPSSVVVRGAFLAFTAAFPLLCWPALAHACSQPKFFALALIVVAGLLLSLPRLRVSWAALPRRFQIALSLWLFTTAASAAFGPFVSGESLLLPLLGAGWLILGLTIRPRMTDLAWALVVGGSLVSIVALLQFARLDPYAWFGWAPLLPGSPRMRVYATLGNPDFVAAFLAGLLPLTYAMHRHSSRRWLLRILLALQIAALCATGSRAILLALIGVLLSCALLRRKRAALLIAIGLLVVAAILAILPGARPLSTTIRGRVYIWQVAASRALEHPYLGFGPGGFAAAYPDWEAARMSSGRTASQDTLFAGPQQHAHNEFLEFLLDGGALGLAAWLALFFAILYRPWRLARENALSGAPPNDTLTLAAATGIVALLAISLVDFPFHRPTELFLFWSLAAIIFMDQSPSSSASSGIFSRRTSPGRRVIP